MFLIRHHFQSALLLLWLTVGGMKRWGVRSTYLSKWE